MEEKIRKYAKFLVEGCLKLKKGDKLFIIGIDLINEFIEIVKEEAIKLGITDIETLITSPSKERELYQTKTFEELIQDQEFDKTKYNKMAKEGYAFLKFTSPAPGIFEGINEELMAKVNNYQMKRIEEYKNYQLKGLIKWNISAVPNEIWAKNIEGISNIDELWEIILNICLINEDDPIYEWNNKILKLSKRAKYLNDLNIDKLVYKNSLGTNLEIGLPNNYQFCSAEGINLVNMPTEEVFTSPDRLRVNGRVYSSKLLLYNNRVVKDFWLEFKDGRIINYDAKEGFDILKGIIETDEGSHFLGEVALVDYNSPINMTNLIFKETLFDENSSCHLAIGEGFPECIKDGLTKDSASLLEMGINISYIHVDFFVGTKDLEIKAILKNKEEVLIMKNGNFLEGGIK